MRLFLDANVLFSAAKTDGAVRQLLRMLREARHEFQVDDYVIAEARHNLIAKGPEALAALYGLLEHCHRHPVRRAGPIPEAVDWLPEKDRPVMSAAILLRCDALITGDRTHFGVNYGKVIAGVTIHSPRSIADALFR
jgi:predicted nucleic acid-binding protein